MDNIASVRRYFAAWTDRDADAILASLIEGGTYQDPSTAAPISGDAIRDYVDRLWSAFPDLTFQEESIGETGPNRVAAQWLMRGTNTGSIMGCRRPERKCPSVAPTSLRSGTARSRR